MSFAHWSTITLNGARSTAKPCGEHNNNNTQNFKPILGSIKIETQLATCVNTQSNNSAIIPGAGFDAPSLAKHLATRSMVRCPFARQVNTITQRSEHNAMQPLNQRPLTHGFTNCKRQANLRGHKHSAATSTPRRCQPNVDRRQSSSECSISCSSKVSLSQNVKVASLHDIVESSNTMTIGCMSLDTWSSSHTP